MSQRSQIVGLDTSFILRLLIGEPKNQAKRALEQLEKLRTEGKRCGVSDLVVSETYYALQYHYEVPKQRALDTLFEFLNSPEIVPLGEALLILEREKLGSAKPGFVDRLIHAHYMRKAGSMLSFEKAARKLTNTIIP